MLSFRRNALRNASLTLFLYFLSSLSFADSSVTTQRTITKLAEGVYEIRHPDAPSSRRRARRDEQKGALLACQVKQVKQRRLVETAFRERFHQLTRQ